MSLLSKNLESLNAGSGYKFSATKIKDLGAAEYTLATIVMDASSSVEGYAVQLEQALKTIFKACDKSPRRDNLMLRVTQFANTLFIGHDHTVCEDYALADTFLDTAYAVVCDGCSASPEVDFGARCMAMSAKRAIRLNQDGTAFSLPSA